MSADINLSWLVLNVILASLLFRSRTGLMTLVTAEFAWVALFVIGMMIGLRDDSLSFLSLTFFLLVLSAVEFGFAIIGFTILGATTKTLTTFVGGAPGGKLPIQWNAVRSGSRQTFTL